MAELVRCVKREVTITGSKVPLDEEEEAKIPRLDLYAVQKAHSWLPPLDPSLDPVERAEWLDFWKEAVQHSVALINHSLDCGRQFDSNHDRWHRWLFDHLALVIRTMHHEELPGQFWQPILALGTEGHHWIQMFLSSWFHWNLQVQPFQDGFVREWRKMIEFVSRSPGWSYQEIRSWIDLDDISCNLMGFGFASISIWHEGHKGLIDEMEGAYEHWAGTHSSRPGCGVHFASFLKQPGAESLLVKGIIWLDTAVSKAPDYYFFRDGETRARIRSLLDYCWNSHREALHSNSQAFDAFRRLATRLAAFWDPVANEILREIALESVK